MTTGSETKVLVDTSVFIDFFRGHPPEGFEQLLVQNRILLSRFVRIELLQGVRDSELRQLNYVLGGLEIIPHHPDLFGRVETMIFDLKKSHLVAGVVDLLLAAEAFLMGCPVFSKDKVFGKLRQRRLIPGLYQG